ncbi:hypothetical protein ABPG72_003626 [Tetrahymena utriculariae]
MMDRRQSIKQNKLEYGNLGDQILKTSWSFERLRRQSSINTMISFGNNQGAIVASRSQERSEMKKNLFLQKVKMIEQNQQRVPLAHQNRNAALKKQFSIEERAAQQNEEFKSNSKHFQNLFDELLYSNEQKLKKFQELQQKQSNVKEDKMYEGQPNSVFTSSYKEAAIQQFVDVRAIYDLSMQSYDNDINFQAIFERAQKKKSELEFANERINNEIEKENQMKYQISCLQKNKIHLDQQVNDLTQLHKQYDLQISEIYEKALLLKKQTQFQNYNKNQILKLINDEIEKNQKYIQSYKNNSDKEGAYIKEELKNYNQTQDQIQKIQKKLESQDESIKNLEGMQESKLMQINGEQTLNTQKNTICMLYKTFVAKDEGMTDFDFQNAIDYIDRLEMESEQLGMEKLTQKEESNKLEDVNNQLINEMTEQIIIQFQKYQDLNQINRARIGDLLIQKNDLLYQSPSYHSEQKDQLYRKKDITSFQQKIEFNYLEITQQDQEKQKVFQNSRHELADLEYLISKCYLFVGQILFRFCRTLISVRQLIYQIEDKVQEQKLLIHQKHQDESQDENQMSNSSFDSQKDNDDDDDEDEEEQDDDEGKLSEIINQNQRFFSILDVIMNYISQTNQAFESPVNYAKSSIYKEAKKQENQISINKNQKLQNVFNGIFSYQQDCFEEFFELIKKDLILYYFCKLRNFSDFFKQIKLKVQEKIQEEKIKQLKQILSQKDINNQGSQLITDYENIYYEETAAKSSEKEIILQLFTDNLQLLKQQGQENFLKIINNKFSYITYLIKTCFQQNVIHKSNLIPKLQTSKADQSQAVLQKQKSTEQKFPVQKKYDWKSQTIQKKISEIQTQKGFEEFQINIISKRANLLPTRNIQSQQSTSITTETSPILSINKQKYDKNDIVDIEEDKFLLDQNKDQKKLIQQEINEILESKSSTDQIISQPFQNYLEKKIRLAKIQNEEKDLWQKRKNFEKDCNLIQKMDNQPFLSYFDIKYGFQSHRQLLQKPDNVISQINNPLRKSLNRDLKEESKNQQDFEKSSKKSKQSLFQKQKERQNSQRNSFTVNTDHTQYSSLQNTPKQQFTSKFNHFSTKNSFRLKEEFKRDINFSIKNYIDQKSQQRDLSHQSKEKFFDHKRNNTQIQQFYNSNLKTSQNSYFMNRVKSNSVFEINSDIKKQNKINPQSKNNSKTQKNLSVAQYDLLSRKLLTDYYQKPQSIFQPTRQESFLDQNPSSSLFQQKDEKKLFSPYLSSNKQYI